METPQKLNQEDFLLGPMTMCCLALSCVWNVLVPLKIFVWKLLGTLVLGDFNSVEMVYGMWAYIFFFEKEMVKVVYVLLFHCLAASKWWSVLFSYSFFFLATSHLVVVSCWKMIGRLSCWSINLLIRGNLFHSLPPTNLLLGPKYYNLCSFFPKWEFYQVIVHYLP